MTVATTQTRSDAVKILISAVEHFVGARYTRTTWQASLVLVNGESIPCGHHMHPTTDAATICGRAMWRRLPTKVVSAQ